MAVTPGLPAGERLPEYDDEPAVELETLRAWLVKRHPGLWGQDSVSGIHNAPSGALQTIAIYEREIIRDVIAALQAVGAAQLVKNGTYRAMARDGRDVERLAAWLTNSEPITLMEHDGNPVDAAIFLLNAARSAAGRGQV